MPVGDIFRTLGGALLVGIGFDQAGVDGEPVPTNQPFHHAAPDHRLEHLAQQVAVAEAAMPVLGEGRVVRHVAVEAEPTEPAIGQVQMHFLAESPFRPDAEAIANDQHPDHQFGIDRRPPDRTVEGRQLAANLRQVDKAIDRPHQVITRHMPVE